MQSIKIFKPLTSFLAMLALAGLLVVPLSGCETDEGPAEEMGEEIDDAVDEVEDAVEDVKDEATDDDDS